MAKNAKFNAATMWDDLGNDNAGKAEKKDIKAVVEKTEAEPAKEISAPLTEVKKESKQKKETAVAKEAPAKKVAEVREVSTEKEVKADANEDEVRQALRDELESTVGHKGMKLKKLIFCVTDELFEYVDKESRRRGISRRVFVNEIIKKYKDSPEGRAVID